MTWPWEAVREEACRYYFAEGKSLTEVKKLIKRKRPGFDPSDRAYRLKFNEWNVKRPRRTKADAATSSRLEAVATSADSSNDVAADAGPLSVHHRSAQSATLPASIDLVHGRAHVSHACSCCAVHLDAGARELFMTVEQGDDTFLAWTARYMNVSGVDNIVHLLARDLKWTHLARYNVVFTRLLDLFKRSSVSLDLRDCDGLTALAISIQTDNLQAANILLDNGASLEVCSRYFGKGDDYNKPPLELALTFSPNIRLIAELLRRTREADLSYDTIKREECDLLNEQALRNIDAIVSSSQDDAELEDAFYVVDQLVLHTRRGNRTGRLFILGVLLENWDHRKLSSSTRRGEQWAFRCISRISECKEFQWAYGLGLGGLRVGETCNCEDYGAFIVFHIDDEALVEMLLGGLDSILDPWSILSPCPARIGKRNTEYLSKFLERTVKNEDDLEILVEGLVLNTPSEMAPAFLEKPGWRAPTVPPCSPQMGCNCIIFYPGLETEVGAALLGADGTLALSRSRLPIFNAPRPIRTSPLAYASDSYLDYLCHLCTKKCVVNNLSVEYPVGQDWVNNDPCGCHARIRGIKIDHRSSDIWQARAQDAAEIQRYVIYVVTKDLCNEKSLFAPKQPLAERLQSALKLRQRFDLPNLTIEPDVLLQALNGTECTHRNDPVEEIDAPTRQADSRWLTLRNGDEILELDEPQAQSSRS